MTMISKLMCSPKTILAALFLLTNLSFAESVNIQLAHNTGRERKTQKQLEHVLTSYDLTKYTFTHDVIIEERAIAHAFPVLTLNARFADSPDELLSQFVHEQFHWYLREHDADQRAAVRELQAMYPNAPAGLPLGAETLYSTYGHLVDCYLEIQADRQLIGPQRTMAVIKDKGRYTWIYQTVLDDEPKIAAVVQEHHLEFK